MSLRLLQHGQQREECRRQKNADKSEKRVAGFGKVLLEMKLNDVAKSDDDETEEKKPQGAHQNRFVALPCVELDVDVERFFLILFGGAGDRRKLIQSDNTNVPP